MNFDVKVLQTILENRAVQILLAFLLAFLFSFFSRRIARRIVSFNRFAPETHRLRSERQETLKGIFAGVISLGAFAFAIFFCVGQFVDLSTLVWVVGLFSAAFGLGVRPLISDFLTGVVFVFEDTLDVGEKVEIIAAGSFEGVIEQVNLRVVHLRGMGGELFVIPNGEIRIIRNFSRGHYSAADIIIKVQSKDISRALEVLSPLGTEAMTILPNLIEPWRVISHDGTIGQHTELQILAKARFGHAAEMRPRMQALIHERLANSQVALVD